MKTNNFLYSLFLILFILQLGCSDDFEKAELNGGCFDQFPTVGYYNGQRGVIQGASLKDVPNLILIGDLDKNGYYVFPCNLPAEYQLNGSEVIFDAEIKDIPTMHCDTLQDGTIECVPLDIEGTPVTLTSLKVKELF
jgi:hypothetical protein